MNSEELAKMEISYIDYQEDAKRKGFTPIDKTFFVYKYTTNKKNQQGYKEKK
jgi:hypothetical protein